MVTETASCTRCGHPVLSGARYCQNCGADVSQEQGLVPTTPLVTPLRSSPQIAALDMLREETLGEYEIQVELGRGGMATVYLAHDIALGRRVAIKVMSPALVEEGVAERFRREARTAASLNHPHIIPIYTVRERPHLLYFVMKFIQGPSLDPILKRTGWLPIPMVELILAQAASALGYAHRRGVIHRDVKPANIMLDEDGWVVVTDFGIAKVSTATNLTMTGVTVGTPAYMSPEQCMGREVTGASDQYSLGVVAYQLITGQRPFNATSAMSMMYAHFNETPRPLRELRPDCPPELEAAVLRMLAKDAADRWASIDEAFGSIHITPDDATRNSLAALVLSSSNASLTAEISTPTSPVPPAKRSSAPTVPTVPPPSVPAPGGPPTPAGTRTPVRPLQRSEVGPGPGEAAPYKASVYAPQPAEGPPAESGASVPRLIQRHRAWLWTAFTSVCALLLYVLVQQRVRSGAGGGTETAVQPTPADTTGSAVTTVPADSTPASDTLLTLLPKPAASAVSVAEVLLSPAKVTLEPGRSARLRLELRAARHVPIREPRSTSWSSSAPLVATVDSSGTVRGVAPGTATITALVEGKTGHAQIDVPTPKVSEVRPAPVATVILTPAAVSVPVGGSVTLTATPQDARGASLADRPVTWSTTGPAVTVSPGGQVVGVVPGTAVVRAEVEGQLGSATVTVTPAAVAEVRLTPAGDSLSVGQAVQLTAAARDAHGGTLSDRKVAWESSDTSVATVSAGLVTGRRPGTARITAAVEDHTATAQIKVLPPPVDPAVERVRAVQEINLILDAFVKAVNARSVAQLRQAYPGMTSSDEAQWRTLLEGKTLVRLVASLEPSGDPRVEQETAESSFHLLLRLTYSGQPTSSGNVPYQAHFRREAGKWRLVRLQQQ
jgi:serine/threonine-protein kinase